MNNTNDSRRESSRDFEVKSCKFCREKTDNRKRACDYCIEKRRPRLKWVGLSFDVFSLGLYSLWVVFFTGCM